jgi:hypothetical protein
MVLEIGAAWVWENFGKELLANLGDVSKQWIDKVNWSRASRGTGSNGTANRNKRSRVTTI